jgi:hypothetical protein
MDFGTRRTAEEGVRGFEVVLALGTVASRPVSPFDFSVETPSSGKFGRKRHPILFFFGGPERLWLASVRATSG